MNTTVRGYREVEEERRVAPYRLIISVHQFRQTLHMLVFCIMVEPSRTYAGVGLARTPHIAILHSVVQHMPRRISRGGHQTPVSLTHVASLRTYPAQVATVATIVPYHGFRLQLTYHAECLCPLVVGLAVDLARLVSTAIPAVTTIGTVKPYLKDIAILG